MIKYVFRDAVPVIIMHRDQADPQRIGEAIDKARKATPAGGDVRELLERQARSKRHVLHPHLEWDDAVCGRKYRMEQINDLIRIIAIEDADGAQKPAFISVTASDAPRAFYSPLEIARSQSLQDAALDAADRDLAAFQRRHRWLCDICVEVAAIREKIRERRERRSGESPSADAA